MHINCNAVSARRSSLASAAVCDIFPAWPPHVIIKEVEILGIWWPTVVLNDLRTVCVQTLLRDTCRVCWSSILLKTEPAGINCLQSSISLISILCTNTHELLLLLRIPVHAASAFAFCQHATPFPF